MTPSSPATLGGKSAPHDDRLSVRGLVSQDGPHTATDWGATGRSPYDHRVV